MQGPLEHLERLGAGARRAAVGALLGLAGLGAAARVEQACPEGALMWDPSPTDFRYLMSGRTMNGDGTRIVAAWNRDGLAFELRTEPGRLADSERAAKAMEVTRLADAISCKAE